MNEQLEKIAKFFNTDKVVSNEEMQSAIDAIAQVLLTFKEATSQINQDTQRQLGELMSKVEEAYQKNVGEVSMAQLEQAIAYVRSKVDEVMAMRPRDGRDGVDGRDGKNGKDGRDGRDGKNGSPDTAEQIKGKLETLKGDARLDASAIKNLPEATQTVVREMTLGQVETPLKAGTGITITKDATGAKVISSTGGGDVTKVGTPVNNQVGVWTGDGTLEGDTALTFDTGTDRLSTTTSGIVETGTVELGHASDTTLSRSAAGVLAVEGVPIIKATSGVGNTPTSSSTVTVTHGLGRTPSIIRISAKSGFTSNAAATPTTSSEGCWDSSGNRCIYQGINGTTTIAAASSTTFAVFMDTSVGNNISGIIQNVGATTFDIVFTETGTHTRGVYMWQAQ